MKQELDRILKDGMRPDEEIIWHGKTEPFGLLEAKSGKSVLIRWIAATGVIVGVLVLYFVRAGDDLMLGFIAMMLALLAGIFLLPVLDRRALLKQEYWITNQRAILKKDDEVFCMGLDQMKRYWIESEEGQSGKHIVLGEPLAKAIKHSLRSWGCHPMVEQGKTEAKGLVFYNVPNAETIREFL